MRYVRPHLAGEDGGVVDGAGDVDGAAQGDVEAGGAQDGGGGLQYSQPDLVTEDGTAGHLADVQPAVLRLHRLDAEAPVRAVGEVGGLVPQVGGVGVPAHRQQVEAVLPQPGHGPVAQPVDPAVEASLEAGQGSHVGAVVGINVGLRQRGAGVPHYPAQRVLGQPWDNTVKYHGNNCWASSLQIAENKI